jgi:hypothetical protein
MKRRKKLLCLSILLIITQAVLSQNDEKIDTLKLKLNLTQYVFSCHSIYYTAIKQQTIEDKYFMSQIGLNYVEKANENWIKLMQFEFIKDDTVLNEAVPKVLEFYEKTFSDFENLPSIQTAFVIHLISNRLEQIVQLLWKVDRKT